MIMFPKDDPVFEGLNTYYLIVPRFFEHLQGSVGSGAVYFESGISEGIIYFDQNSLINGIYLKGKTTLFGNEAINKILEEAPIGNFKVSAYAIRTEHIYLWAHIMDLEPLYKQLSSEFTDLHGLIRKMVAENLTGVIEIILRGKDEGEYLFFESGKLIGGSYSWMNERISNSEENLNELVAKVRQQGAIFNVNIIAPKQNKVEQAPKEQLPVYDTSKIINELLASVEKLVHDRLKGSRNFSILLKKKFIEKIDRYPFLDPFGGDVEYSEGKVVIDDRVNRSEVVSAILECVMEVANNLRMSTEINELIRKWQSEYKVQV